MNIKILVTLFIFTGSILVSSAQIQHGGVPISWVEQSSSLIEFAHLPSVDIASLQAEDLITEEHKDIPLRFAHAHEVNFNMLNSGTWTSTAEGGKIWRLGIESTGAHSLNLTFDQFMLAEGSEVFIYNEDRSHVIGSFTSENNKPSEHLGTAPIRGDKIILEFYEPAGAVNASKLSISHVAHDYKNAFSMAKSFGDSGNCNNNIKCPVGAGWQDQISSVALITLGNGTRWCTGTILANTSLSDTPYFLTADHCEDGQNVTNWVFYFNYESPTCSPNTDGSLTQSVSGSTLRAQSPGTDVCLLELTSVPPASYNTFYSGWDKSGSAVPGATGIHHPSGDVKKFSVENDPLTSSGNYWTVNDWDDGTTEPGSSGSVLYDPNKRVVGQLFGGGAACGNNNSDSYGKFSVSWNGPNSASRLKDWLDPNNTGNATQDGYFFGSSALNELNTHPIFEVYPNPAADQLTIKTNAVIDEIVIYDMNGAIVQIETISNFSIEKLQSGMYYIQLISTEGVFQSKFVKK